MSSITLETLHHSLKLRILTFIDHCYELANGNCGLCLCGECIKHSYGYFKSDPCRIPYRVANMCTEILLHETNIDSEKPSILLRGLRKIQCTVCIFDYSDDHYDSSIAPEKLSNLKSKLQKFIDHVHPIPITFEIRATPQKEALESIMNLLVEQLPTTMFKLEFQYDWTDYEDTDEQKHKEFFEYLVHVLEMPTITSVVFYNLQILWDTYHVYKNYYQLLKTVTKEQDRKKISSQTPTIGDYDFWMDEDGNYENDLANLSDFWHTIAPTLKYANISIPHACDKQLGSRFDTFLEHGLPNIHSINHEIPYYLFLKMTLLYPHRSLDMLPEFVCICSNEDKVDLCRVMEIMNMKDFETITLDSSKDFIISNMSHFEKQVEKAYKKYGNRLPTVLLVDTEERQFGIRPFRLTRFLQGYVDEMEEYGYMLNS